MEAQDTGELIEQPAGDKNKTRTALTISFFAMVLAFASLGGSNTAKEATQENILAANAYSFYQAKTIRQTALKIRYESEPETKEGKKELMVQAKSHEAARDRALRQDPWFDYAEGMVQIAIVLLSVSLIGSIPALFLAGSFLGGLGLLSTVNGFFLLV